MNALSHPFRLGLDGAAATVVVGSDEANLEAVAIHALTRKGERPLVPTFGTTDPVFADVDVAELNASLDTFGPDVTVTDLELEAISDTAVRAVLTFADR